MRIEFGKRDVHEALVGPYSVHGDLDSDSHILL